MSKKIEKKESPVAAYPLRIQAIRTKGQNVRFFVYIPMPLAAALGVEGGEEVTWELLSRAELHLVRKSPAPVKAKKRA
jgi:hypothetical protein